MPIDPNQPENQCESHSKEHIDLETVLSDVYGNGTFHIVLLVFTSVTCFLFAMEIQSIVFMHDQTQHFCTDDVVIHTNDTVTWVEKPDLSIDWSRTRRRPTKSDEQCWGFLSSSALNLSIPFVCTNWTYKRSEMRQTVITDFNLVCDREHWIPWLESAYLFFHAVGYVIGFLSDKLGRKIPLFVFCIWSIIISLLTPFAQSVNVLFVLRCCIGMTAPLSYLGMTIITELVPIRHRAAYGNIYWIPWAIGYMVTPGIAYLTENWRSMRLWCCIFQLIFVVYPFIVCESPRWLCMRGRTLEAIGILRRIAKWNNAKLPPDYFERFEKSLELERSRKLEATNSKHSDQGWDILRHAHLRYHTLIFCFVQSSIVIVYFGIILDEIFAMDNLFMNVFLMGIVELPTTLLAWAACIHLGRRLSSSLTVAAGGAVVLITKIVGSSFPITRTICALLGKLLITVTCSIADVYIAEYYPTTVRGIGFFTVVTVASVFSAVSPFISDLVEVYFYLPSIIYLILCMISALLIYTFLPETKDCPLAQTIEDTEGFVKGKEREWCEKMRCKRDGVFVKMIEIENI